MKIDETVSYLLSKVSTRHRNLLERSMNEIGLHSGQVFVLFELWRRDGQRQIDLAANLGLSAPTVNKMVRGMADVGLVALKRLEEDARSVRIYLTPRGVDLRSAIEGQWQELEEEIVTPLTETERLVLTELLKKLRLRGLDPDEVD